MELTFIQLAGVTIQEPITFLTDVLLGIECLIFFFILWTRYNESPVARWTAAFFLLFGLGTIEGGIVNHAIQYMVGPAWKFPMVLLVGSSIPCLVIASLYSLRPRVLNKPTYSFWIALVSVEYVAFLIYLTQQPRVEINFKTLIPHLVVGMVLFAASLQYYGHRRDPQIARKWKLAGIIATLPAGLIVLLKINPNIWFNTFDLVHVVLMVPTYLIFVSAKSFAQHTPDAPIPMGEISQ